MNRLRKEQRDKIIMVGIGSALISALLWFFLLGAQEQYIEKLEQNIRETKDKVVKAEARLRRGHAIHGELEELRDRLGAMEGQLIPQEQVGGRKWLLDKITAFVQNKYDLTVTRLSDPDVNKRYLPLPKMDYSAVSYLVDVRGLYHEFGRFLADFENANPYLSIQKVQMSPVATPSAATGSVGDSAEDLSQGANREKLSITMRVVVPFRPTP